ncbi:MAG: hypothetical protein ACHQAV_00085 [Solirubrobacterales bacterium]
MRSIKLLPALAASATLLALAAAGASARPAGHRHATRGAVSSAGGCHVTIEGPKSVITFGEPVTLSGVLTCPNAGGQTVTIYQGILGTHSFTVAGTATTETSGSTSDAYQFAPPSPSASTIYYAIAAGARSAHKVVKVAPQVTTTAPADGTQVFAGGGSARARALNTVTFKGKVNPIEVGALVALQRENATANEEWHRIDLGRVNREGEYSIRHTFGAPGDANIRVVVHPASGAHKAPGASTPISLEISQRQNPQLTISSSSDPISYGGSVTISGVAAGAPSQSLTLLARVPGGKFAPVATTTSAGGKYAFTQSPLRSTAYQVTSATTKSSILFEGVKYVLTATPVALTAQAGKALTFTGTVAPVHAGHVIYLERQGPAGLGFNVAEVGTVSAAGTYSISRTFFGAGAMKLRIKIPGDPENQGVASQLFEANVTHAPAGALLKPQEPGKQPSVGQL